MLRYSEIIQNQPILNIGTTGSVSNGKSQTVRALTGVATQRFRREVESNITIHLGYANCKIYRSRIDGQLKSTHSDIMTMLDQQGHPMELISHISFIDCPGHQSFMSNMISGTAIMDVALLLVAVNADLKRDRKSTRLNSSHSSIS